MALIDFSSIRELISKGGSKKEKQDLFKEVLLMVLARATRADSNVEAIEITHVQTALKEVTGEDFTEADVLTAASSEVFETQSLERSLANASRKLTEEERVTILACLANIIRSDTHIRYHELDFFDHVATALRATPSEIAGLVASDK